MRAVILAYVAMLAFDAFVLGGCAYLIEFHHWSAWWVVIALMIIDCSSPKKLLDAARPSPPREKQ